jgi:hypothetical protein
MVTSFLPDDDLESTLPEWHEPFPEPQTIPSGWDLSDAIYTSAVDSLGDGSTTENYHN